ncbi:restriction endonuclease [Dongia deserti]|uniref:restriction endonuclease n=1 Tax=Dongia deserti TaxID=2268030 RepID=UPI000E65A875|nr:restriction endonuclease [Dongia deserti]
MAVPDYQTLMLPLLKCAATGEVNSRDCMAKLADEFSLTDEDRAQLLPSGRQTLFYNRLQWAKTYLVQAGLLEMTKRAHFRASEAGKKALSLGLERIDNHFLEQYEPFREFKSRKGSEEGEILAPSPASGAVGELPPETPEERIDDAFAEIVGELRTQLLQQIMGSSPAFFERLIIDLLLAMGYGGSRAEAGRQLGKSGDGGIDGVINEDALGLGMIYLQAKRYAPNNTVGEGEIRGFSGALLRHGSSKGVFVTTSRFSDAAKSFALEVRQQRLVLIDGEQLTRLMIKHGVGVRTERVLELKKLDLDYFDEDE